MSQVNLNPHAGEEPMESEADYQRAIDSCVHLPELVSDSPYRVLRTYRCAKCFEPMFEVGGTEEAPWWDR